MQIKREKKEMKENLVLFYDFLFINYSLNKKLISVVDFR